MALLLSRCIACIFVFVHKTNKDTEQQNDKVTRDRVTTTPFHPVPYVFRLTDSTPRSEIQLLDLDSFAALAHLVQMALSASDSHRSVAEVLSIVQAVENAGMAEAGKAVVTAEIAGHGVLVATDDLGTAIELVEIVATDDTMDWAEQGVLRLAENRAECCTAEAAAGNLGEIPSIYRDSAIADMFQPSYSNLSTPDVAGYQEKNTTVEQTVAVEWGLVHFHLNNLNTRIVDLVLLALLSQQLLVLFALLDQLLEPLEPQFLEVLVHGPDQPASAKHPLLRSSCHPYVVEGQMDVQHDAVRNPLEAVSNHQTEQNEHGSSENGSNGQVTAWTEA